MRFVNLFDGYNEKEDFRILICASDIEEAQTFADEYLVDACLEGNFLISETENVDSTHYDCDYVISTDSVKKGNPVVNELQNAINNATDSELVEAGIGCVNMSENREYAYCKYMENMRCTKGAFLTSTSIGAHPADCPMYKCLK